MSSQESEHVQNEIKENLDKVISGYFREFLNKFDNFSNQIRIADVLLKAYQYRYEKMKGKFSNISDIIASNYESQKELYTKIEKLDTIDAKLTQVELKLMMIADRVDSIGERLEKKKNSQTQIPSETQVHEKEKESETEKE